MATYKRGSGNYKSSFLQLRIKSVDQVKNSDVTYADDSELVIPVRANKNYFFIVWLIHNSGTDPDFKYKIVDPSGATIHINQNALTHQTASITVTGNPAVALTSTGADLVTGVMGHCIVGSTPGNISVQWAQQTSDAGATTLLAGSTLLVFEA